MSAISVVIDIDRVERLSVLFTSRPAPGGSTAFVDIDEMAVIGKNPEMFRRIAARFSEAAARLEEAAQKTGQASPFCEAPAMDAVAGDAQ